MTLHTRVTTPFTRDSTADEVLAGVDLHGRRAIVTGATSGIGAETARALASAGAEVSVAVEDLEDGERTAADISSKTGNRRVLVSLACPLVLQAEARWSTVTKERFWYQDPSTLSPRRQLDGGSASLSIACCARTGVTRARPRMDKQPSGRSALTARRSRRRA